MRPKAHKSILTIKPYVPGKPIEEVKREFGLRHVIKLASNESPFGPSPKVLKAIQAAAKVVNRYPDGDCFLLRQELAKRLRVKPRQLIFGNGSDEVIVLAIRAFVGPGDEVVLAKPSFLVYEIASKIAGARLKHVPLRNFRYDLAAMKKAVTAKTKIVFLGNPDNPSGMYLPDKDLVNFLKGLRRDIVVLIDEAYFEFVRAADYGQAIRLINRYPNVLVTRTFSKMYGLAGLRVGYGVGDEGMIDLLNRIREPFNVNSIAQAAALAALKDRAYYKKISATIDKQRRFLLAGLLRLNLKVVDSCANFILIDVGASAPVIANKLLKKGVIVRGMGFWGLKGHIRVTIGAASENKRFINALEAVL
jgi:histidinol-phosphate aminotransferase